MVFIVVVDGLIASGKSSILRELAQKYGFEVEQQRVSDWTLLTPFYSDPKKYAVDLQYQILESYKKIWEKHSNDEEKEKIVFLEAFSLSSFEVFARMLHDDGLIEENDLDGIEKYAHNSESKKLYPDLFLYLDCKPDLCMERIKIRGRPGEENIKKQYMERLDSYYNNFIEKHKNHYPILKLDNNTHDQASKVAQLIINLCRKRCK